MPHSSVVHDNNSFLKSSLKSYQWWLGIILVAIIAAMSILASKLDVATHMGLSALTLAIVFGIFIGNTFFPRVANHTAIGVDYAKNKLLRVGIVLYGFRITFQQIEGIGWAGIIIDILMISCTFILAYYIGTKLLRLDKQTTMLIGAGSSICGAAAIMAAEPVIKGQAHKVSVAVATVVVFGTIAMFLYPLIYPYLDISAEQYGMFAGSTIHEVAQVVAAGRSVSEDAANTAVIVKMIRVMVLAPFLIVLSTCIGKETHDTSHKSNSITIPWFAVLFIVASGINSLNIIPPHIVNYLIDIDSILLAMAMAALGLRTHIGAIHQAGVKPLILAAILFLFLCVGGFFINLAVLILF